MEGESKEEPGVPSKPSEPSSSETSNLTGVNWVDNPPKEHRPYDVVDLVEMKANATRIARQHRENVRKALESIPSPDLKEEYAKLKQRPSGTVAETKPSAVNKGLRGLWKRWFSKPDASSQAVVDDVVQHNLLTAEEGKKLKKSIHSNPPSKPASK